MDRPQNQNGDRPQEEQKSTNDVDRLYNWANVQNANYRTFSRHRSSQSPQSKSPAANVAASEEANSNGKSGLAPRPGASRPAVAIASLAGGTGKTTICANLGQVLCSMGERILLVDGSGSGLLPFYFGAVEIRPGLRTFEVPAAGLPPLQVLGTETADADWLRDEVALAMPSAQRTLFDLPSILSPLLPQVLIQSAILLTPLLPDITSTLTVPRVEAAVGAILATGIEIPLPFYLFNQFDDHDPAHQQARDSIAARYPERTLPFTISKSPVVKDALSHSDTVAGYAPDSEAAQDFIALASWLRNAAPVTQAAKPQGRWRER
jgi:cellulose biosynthesis protein BcsQ